MSCGSSGERFVNFVMENFVIVITVAAAVTAAAVHKKEKIKGISGENWISPLCNLIKEVMEFVYRPSDEL